MQVIILMDTLENLSHVGMKTLAQTAAYWIHFTEELTSVYG